MKKVTYLYYIHLKMIYDLRYMDWFQYMDGHMGWWTYRWGDHAIRKFTKLEIKNMKLYFIMICKL